MHLRTLHVHLSRDFTADAMKALELDKASWSTCCGTGSCTLNSTRSGKQVIVDKTPPNTLIWPRLHRCWPNARYILLLRHPGAVVASSPAAAPTRTTRQIRAEVLHYSEKLEEARQNLDVHVIRTRSSPRTPRGHPRASATTSVSRWEPAMLDYGAKDHGTFRPQLGDWCHHHQVRPHPAGPRGGPDGSELPPAPEGVGRDVGVPGRAPGHPLRAVLGTTTRRARGRATRSGHAMRPGAPPSGSSGEDGTAPRRPERSSWAWTVQARPETGISLPNTVRGSAPASCYGRVRPERTV